MPVRCITLLDVEGSPWCEFMEEFFDDTPSQLHIFHNASQANVFLDRSKQDVFFIEGGFLSLPLSQKLKVCRQSILDFRLFGIGDCQARDKTIPFDAWYEKPSSLIDFQKDFVQHLPLPETVRVLVVDDERETGNMIRDFLAGRIHPTFEVEYAFNGEEGLKSIEKGHPDVLVLDLKMPVLDGREVYRIIQEKKLSIPVIVFFDALFGEDLVQIRKYGRPAVVEKGAPLSAMPEMMALIKKMAYFG